MQIEAHDLGDVVVLRMEGQMDIYNCRILKEHIDAIKTGGKCKVVANLEKVSYVDSSGIGALIGAVTSLKKGGGGMKLCSMSEFVQKIIRFVGVQRLLETYDTESEAVEGFRA
jgi:anti-sigma B factor antagonist